MTDQSVAAAPRLSLRTKTAYGLGAIANGVAVAGLAAGTLQIFLNQVLGLNALLAGSLIMVSMMADAVIDPLIGRWSDTLKTRWGRRHPFMYAAALPAGLCMWLLWNAPHGLSGGGLVAFMVALMILVRVTVSLFEIPSNALTPEFSPNYDERTRLQSYRWFFGIVGGAALSLVLTNIFLAKSASNPLGILNRAGYEKWAGVAAAVIFVAILISAVGTHDRIPYLPKPRRKPQTLKASAREIARTLANRSLIALLLGAVIGGMGAGLRSGLSIYLYTHFWGLEPQQFGILIPLGSVGSIIAVFLATPLGRRFGKKPAMIGLFLISVFLFAAPFVLRLVGWFPVNGSPWLMPLLALDAMVTAAVAVVGFILAGSMIADVVEDAAVKTGVRSEGLLYSMSSLLGKFTAGLGVLVTGGLLDIVHFPAHALRGTVSAATMNHLVILYIPINAAFSLVS
ncbi:MAG: MFS transporter, partial [Caulobacteraceae bacterium]